MTDAEYYVAAAARAALNGEPFESLADWAAQEKAKAEAAKVVNLDAARARLRPQH